MDDAVKKGCHPTAPKHAAFIAQEMLEFAESGYWTILPYSEVRHLPGLRGSPSHMKEELDRSITEELLAGARALSFADRHHFDLNLSDLLDKSTQYKRNWLLNVIAARQRFERQQANYEGIQTLSIAKSKLIKWMTTGQAS